LISPYTVGDVRVCGWLLLLLAWGAVQFPMAWCDHSGLHPEIPVSHDDHDHDEAHERVDLDLVLVIDEVGLSAPSTVRIDDHLDSMVRNPQSSAPERAAAPPGRLTTVRLL
jgi:hypothetical protein